MNRKSFVVHQKEEPEKPKSREKQKMLIMKNSNSFQLLVNDLEQISEDQHGKLIGGFAQVEGGITSLNEGDSNFLANCSTNNCNGGNCTSGCGTIQ